MPCGMIKNPNAAGGLQKRGLKQTEVIRFGGHVVLQIRLVIEGSVRFGKKTTVQR